MFKRILIFLIILGVFFTGLNYLGIALDEQALEYTELLPLVDVAPQNNGFDVLEDGLDKLEELDREPLELLLDDQWNKEKANELIEQYSEHVQLIENTLKKTVFKSYPINFYSSFPDYSRYADLVDLIIIRSRYFAKQNRIAESLSELQLAVDFVERTKSDQSAILVPYLVGLSNQHKALTWAHELISSDSLTQDELTQLAQLIETIPDYQHDGFNQILSGEFAFMQSMPEDTLNPKLVERVDTFFNFRINMQEYGVPISIFDLLAIPSHHYFFQKHRSANQTYIMYLDLQNQAKDTYCNKIDYLEKTTSTHFLEIVGMNGGFNTGMDRFPMRTYLERRCFANFYVQAIKTVVAFKRYAEKHQTPAPSLSQLVPEFLTEIPIDAFTGESILYNAEAQTIYSRGTNSVDNGGQEINFIRLCQGDENCKINPTVEVEFSGY